MNARLIGTAVIAALVAVGCGKKDGPRDADKADAKPAESADKADAKPAESGEQAAEPNHVEEILALAKKSAEEDNNINFYGFFPGMSRYDAADLAAHYKLKEDECRATAWPGKAAHVLWFSLKGVHRLTGGGNTEEELAQAVANRVGDLKGNEGFWSRRTIDGGGVEFSSNGLVIWNDSAALQDPIVTKRNEQREANVQNEFIKDIIGNMVAIPGKNFKMGKYEVTQPQWQVVMGKNPSKFKHAGKPVECVSWNDCKEFLEKLNAMPEVRASGLTFRLPSEEEWVYACLAGGTDVFCRLADGSEITRGTLSKVAWYSGNSSGMTHSVGRKMPNAFGLYDMHGNVSEWCEDLYKADDSICVNRGGSWFNSSSDCAAGGRGRRSPDDRRDSLGFRLAASQDVNR
ncbi:MAG: formylglycine-generating enzyme family protein [Kiritimatiellae bacterium]|nr:formylglycine-generating enzyme family protein [Kiritimatiellia bacterium]